MISEPAVEIEYDVVFLLDSYAITRNVFEEMRAFLAQQLNIFYINDGKYRVGLALYTGGSDVKSEWQLNSYTTDSEMLNAIFEVAFTRGSGQREIGKAIDFIRENMFTYVNGDRNNARNLIVFLTSNEKGDDTYEAYRAAERAEDASINLYTVGFYLDDTEEIRQISTWPLRTYNYIIKSFDDVGILPTTLTSSSKCCFCS